MGPSTGTRSTIACPRSARSEPPPPVVTTTASAADRLAVSGGHLEAGGAGLPPRRARPRTRSAPRRRGARTPAATRRGRSRRRSSPGRRALRHRRDVSSPIVAEEGADGLAGVRAEDRLDEIGMVVGRRRDAERFVRLQRPLPLARIFRPTRASASRSVTATPRRAAAMAADSPAAPPPMINTLDSDIASFSVVWTAHVSGHHRERLCTARSPSTNGPSVPKRRRSPDARHSRRSTPCRRMRCHRRPARPRSDSRVAPSSRPGYAT